MYQPTIAVNVLFVPSSTAGRRETGVFTHVAQKYHDMYGDRTNFITSLKGGTNCQRWAGIWQLDSINMFPESGIVAKDVPYTVRSPPADETGP